MSKPDLELESGPDATAGPASAAPSDALSFMFWLSQLASEPSLSGAAKDALFPVPRPFGRFQLESLLGTGTYGAVFRATDMELERVVALKVAWPAVLLDPEASRRFVNEPKTVAALSHPGIVRVYDSGNVEMARFISLEYIAGPTLAEWLKSQDQVPVRTAARIIQQAAEAIHYAHEHGVIHRDLKPSNILLGDDASGPNDPPLRPLITDFGLAHRVRTVEASGATATNAILGTDRYMSPEQASGQTREVDRESDVFSLGVILYELLAGRRPFNSDNATAIREQIQWDDPPRLRPWRKDVPRDLETIVFHCLEKSPSRRYGTAGKLAEDLRRFRTGEPILARPTPSWERAWKFARRRPWAVGVGAGGFLGAIVVSALMGALIEERRSAARDVAAAQSVAHFAEGMEREHQYAAHIRYAARAHARGNRAETMDHLARADRLVTAGVQKGIEWHLLKAFIDEVDRVVPAHRGGTRALRFSPAGDLLVSAGEDDKVIFWDTSTWKQRRVIESAHGAVVALEFSADGNYLATGSNTGTLTVHQVNDASVIFRQQVLPAAIADIAPHGSKCEFAVGGRAGFLAIVDPLKGEVRQTANLEPAPRSRLSDLTDRNEIQSVAYSAQDEMLSVVKYPIEVLAIDPGSATSADLEGADWLREGVGTVTSVDFGSGYFAFSGDRRILLFSVRDRKVAATIPIPALVAEMRYVPSRRSLIGTFKDGSVRAWSLEEVLNHGVCKPLQFPGHAGRATGLDGDREGRWIATGGGDGTIRVWDTSAISGGDEPDSIGQPNKLAFSPCGEWFAVADSSAKGESRVTVFETATGRKRWTANSRSLPIDWQPSAFEPGGIFEFSPSGTELVFLEADGRFTIRASSSGDVLAEIPSRNPTVLSWTFSHDGSMLLGSNPLGTVAIRRSDSLEVAQWSARQPLLASVLTSAGPLWIERGENGSCLLKRSMDGDLLRAIYSEDRVFNAAASRDGRYLATVSRGPKISLWDVAEDREPYTLIGHESRVLHLRFLSRDRVLLSLDEDCVVRLWHIPTKSELMTIGNSDNKVFSFAVNPSESMIALGMRCDGRFSLKVYRLGLKGESLPREFRFETFSE